MKKSQRQYDPIVSIVKGFAILSVVFGHAFFGSIGEHIVNQYHLACFYFISGYCLKDVYISNLKVLFVRRFRSIYLPFLMIGLLFIFLHNIFCNIGIENDIWCCKDYLNALRMLFFSMAPPELLLSPMWFCPALFVVSCLATMCLRVTNGLNEYLRILILLLVLPLFAIFLSRIGMKSYYHLFEYLQICAIFIAGYYYKKIKGITANWYLFSFCIILIFLLNINGIYAYLQLDKIMEENIWGVLLISIAGSLAVFQLALWIRTQKLLSKMLSYIGNCSFCIMAFHILGFKLVSFIYDYIHPGNAYTLIYFPIVKNVSAIWGVLYMLIGVFFPLLLDYIYTSLKHFLVRCFVKINDVS
ncbi:MAG: acyltransferase family protein [Bacteroidaceae bacterium]|nr:acyltransferase family protein [Bacteroidaceae bacterium]